ncbi:MAG: class I SAM-dependent methyltransferase [Actinobacteria bacterium]|nr:class I SAM-dependent methyltransferase [Actinomycetota bacterium]
MNDVLDRAWVALFDRAAALVDRGDGYRLRHQLVAPATGRVLEVGAGTGRNLALYRDADEVVALEPDRVARGYAEQRARLAPVPVTLVDGDAQALPFDDDTFDTVIASLVLCTIPDLDRGLHELRRVLRPEGRLRFWEHVRSDDPRLARWQDRLEGPWGWIGRGCRPNRDTTAELHRAWFEIVDLDAYEAPGYPPIVRPHVIGVATPV